MEEPNEIQHPMEFSSSNRDAVIVESNDTNPHVEDPAATELNRNSTIKQTISSKFSSLLKKMSSTDGKSQSTRFNSKTPRKTSQHVALNTPRNTIHEPTTTMNEPLVSNPVVMITTTHPSTINSQSTRIGNNYVSKIALVDEEGKIVANLENDTLGVVTISNSCGHGQNIRRKSKSQSTRMNHSMAMQAMAVLLTSTETIPTCQQRVMKNTNKRLSVNMSNSVSSVKDKSEQDGPVSQFKQKIRRKSIAFTKKMRFFDSADSMEGDAFVEYA